MSRKNREYSWEKDPYAKEWINRQKESSKKTYKSNFDKWMLFIQMSPTEQYKKRVQDLQSEDPKTRGWFESKVVEYKNSLEVQNYKPETIHTKMTAILSFFTSHRVSLQFRRGELKPRTSKKDKVIEKFVPSNVEIRAMHNLANVRDRTLLLVLYQSGFSPVDALSLNIENIRDVYELEDHYYIQLHREKTNSIQATCISVEAIHEIQSMLKDRGRPTEGPLFVTPKKERLTSRFLNDALKKLAEKALPEDRAEQFITKSLRDAYNCALLEANLMQEVKNLLFGHKRTGAKSSYAYNEQIIRQAYEKTFKFLSINGGRQTKKQLEKIENSLIGLSETVTRQKAEIEDLKQKTNEYRDRMLELEGRIPLLDELTELKKLLYQKQAKKKES